MTPSPTRSWRLLLALVLLGGFHALAAAKDNPNQSVKETAKDSAKENKKESIKDDAKDNPQAGSVRIYRFDNLDIEGHVKTPRLVYFLKRIRNQFRSFRLPEPKFVKQVIETKDAEFLK